MTRLIGVTASVAVAGLLAMTSVSAQGGQPLNGTPSIGTITIESLSIANAPIYAFGFTLEGDGINRTQFSTIDLVRMPDDASPVLFSTAALGRHVQEAQVVVRATPSSAESIYRLHDVIITRLGNDNGVERLSIAYGRIEVRTGSASFCFDVARNARC